MTTSGAAFAFALLVAKEMGKGLHTLEKAEHEKIELLHKGGMRPKAIADEIKRQRLVAEIKGHAKDQGFTLTDDQIEDVLEDCATGTPPHVAVGKLKPA